MYGAYFILGLRVFAYAAAAIVKLHSRAIARCPSIIMAFFLTLVKLYEEIRFDINIINQNPAVQINGLKMHINIYLNYAYSILLCQSLIKPFFDHW